MGCERTNEVRPDDVDQRLVHSTSIQVISHWTKLGLQARGVYISGHTTRHISTSTAFGAGASTKIIREPAGWIINWKIRYFFVCNKYFKNFLFLVYHIYICFCKLFIV